MSESRPQCRLYLITPPEFELASFLPRLKDAFSGGDIATVQLRLKGASDDDILRAGNAIRQLCHDHDAAFILNDRPDLAVRCGADGVHLGQDDGSVKEARRIVGKERVIGVSCHDSRHLAMEAGEDGVDYVAFGAFFPTTSKNPEHLKRWGTPTTDILEWWQAFMLLPCVAIGGINPANCASLARSGADFVAVIQAVWSHPEGAAKAVEAFNKGLRLESYEN